MINNNPDGYNINRDCGATDTRHLQQEVKDQNADIGIAFDGDGDRILVVGKSGKILDGDDLLYLLTLNKETSLDNFGVVGTLMTNKALENYFEQSGCNFIRAEVGDKYVLDELLKNNWFIGGEPSGHIICLDSSSTGDAVIAALKVLECIKKDSFDVEESLKDFIKYPQTLINIKVADVNKVIMNASFRSALKDIECKLGSEGRVLIRPSGTEPLIRIMVESKNSDLAEDYARKLADLAALV